MLIKLSNEEIVTYWDDVKDTLKFALPPTADVEGDEASLNSILQMLLEGFMQAWALLGDNAVHAIVITTIQHDLGMGTKSLLIYSLYGFKLIDASLWQDGLSTLRTYAKDNACVYITGYTKVPRIVEVVKELGGDVSTLFIKLEV